MGGGGGKKNGRRKKGKKYVYNCWEKEAFFKHSKNIRFMKQRTIYILRNDSQLCTEMSKYRGPARCLCCT